MWCGELNFIQKTSRTVSVFVAVLVFVFLGTSHSFASEKTDEENNVSEVFSDFMDDAFNNINALSVFDSNGTDITDVFLEKTFQYYKQDDYQKIQDMIVDQNLSITHGNSIEMNDDEVEQYMKK